MPNPPLYVRDAGHDDAEALSRVGTDSFLDAYAGTSEPQALIEHRLEAAALAGAVVIAACDPDTAGPTEERSRRVMTVCAESLKQAGGETFSSALLAALAGVNAVAGPGMLDFVLTFSLPKLVLDHEFCGQALHFCRPIEPLDDLPAQQLVDDLVRDGHLLTAPHTLEHWPRELYQTDPVIDRTTRDADAAEPLADLAARAVEQVEQRLARYQPFETDPAIDAEMRRLVLDGMEAQDTLHEVPPPPERKAPEPAPGRRGRRSRRRRG